MVFDVASGAVITFDDIFALGVCSNIPKHWHQKSNPFCLQSIK
jgi:hypothetical protein